MNETEKRTFELTAALAMGIFFGKLIANKTTISAPSLSEKGRELIEDLITLTSITKDLTENIVKEKAPEFWDELSALKVFKDNAMVIDLMDQGDKESKTIDPAKVDTVTPSSEKEDKKTTEKTKAMAVHSMGQFYGNLFLIEELSRIEDLSPDVKELLETIKRAAEVHKELLAKSLMIFDPDLLSLIHEIEADQDLDPGKELAS